MQNINILVVEDDEEINNLVSGALKREGFSITQVFDGQSAIEQFKKIEFSIILLDIMLPGIDGIEVMRRIRQESMIPILIMSAKGGETDRIIGLGVGADDYIVKPFSVAELIARVKAQLRRYIFFKTESTKENTNFLKHRNLVLDLEKYVVKKDNKEISLTAKEFEILKLFLLNPKKVFTKIQIFDSVWGENSIGCDNTVMVHIKRIRNKIEDDTNNPKYILTVWGIGYKLGEEE